MGPPDGRRGGFGQAEVADLAGCDQLTDGARHVLDRHLRVDAVLVEEVDDVHTEPRSEASTTRLICSGRLSSPTGAPSSIRQPNFVAIRTWERSGASASPTSSSLT